MFDNVKLFGDEEHEKVGTVLLVYHKILVRPNGETELLQYWTREQGKFVPKKKFVTAKVVVENNGVVEL